MKRQPTNPRSFLHQLAEPIPRSAAPLLARKPPNNRGIANQSALDLLPPILDTAETPATKLTTQRANPHNPLAQPQPPANTNQPSQSARPDAVNPTPLPDEARTPRTPQPSSPARLVPQHPLAERPSEIDQLPTSSQKTAELEFTSPHSPAAQASSSASNPTAKPSHTGNSNHQPSPGSRIHIGTIEVRVPPTPAQNPQAAPALREVHSRIGPPTQRRAAEPLARPLAWSQGLVQG